jgi:hypothetical protein
MNNIIISTTNLKILEEKKDINDDCICGICTEKFDKTTENYHETICGHEFHYTCISECFCAIATLSSGYSTINKRECPYCRKINPLLPVKMGLNPVKGVHQYVCTNKNSKQKCLATCKTGAPCKNSGKTEYGGYCGIHKNQMNTNS